MRTTLAAPRNLAAEDNGRAATACHDRGVASGATVNATCDGSSDSATTSWSRRANMARSAGDLFHPLLRVCTAYQPTNAVLTLNLHALFWQKLANPRGVQQTSTSLLAQHVLGHPVAAPQHGSTDRQAFERTVRRLLGPSQSLGAVCRSRPSQGLCATAAALAGGLRGGRRAPRARAAPHSRRCVALPRVRDGTQRCDAAENSLQHTAHHADARHG